MIKIVCFDLGGVLVKIHRNWQSCALAAGLSPAEGKSWDEPLESCEAFVKLQAGTNDLDTYLHGLSEYLGCSKPEDALKIHNAILADPYPGTDVLVSELHRAGLLTGCLSNTNAPHWKVMSDPSRFPAIASLMVPVVSHEVQLQKPDPKIYEAFASKANLNGPEILFFDDTTVNVEAARCEGWNAELIDYNGDSAQQIRTHLESYQVELRSRL